MNSNTINDYWRREPKPRREPKIDDRDMHWELFKFLFESTVDSGTVYFRPSDVIGKSSNPTSFVALSKLLIRDEGDLFMGQYDIRVHRTYNRTQKMYVARDINYENDTGRS